MALPAPVLPDRPASRPLLFYILYWGRLLVRVAGICAAIGAIPLAVLLFLEVRALFQRSFTPHDFFVITISIHWLSFALAGWVGVKLALRFFPSVRQFIAVFASAVGLAGVGVSVVMLFGSTTTSRDFGAVEMVLMPILLFVIGSGLAGCSFLIRQPRIGRQ